MNKLFSSTDITRDGKSFTNKISKIKYKYIAMIICAEISEPYSASLENFVRNKIKIKLIKILEIL